MSPLFSLIPNYQKRKQLRSSLKGKVDGHTKNDVYCSVRGRCECKRGFKTVGTRCKHWNVDEYGCLVSHHCTGGAVCKRRRCVCPKGYMKAASGTKCVRRGAVLNIEQGARCDEINELSYCRQGLICHACPGDTDGYKCVRCDSRPDN